MDYPGLSLTAENLIKNNGIDVTLKLVTSGAYDPTTSTNSPDIVASITTSAVVSAYSNHQILTGLVQHGDVKLITSAKGLPRSLEPGDIVEISGISYNVLSSKTVKPGNTSIICTAHLRSY